MSFRFALQTYIDNPSNSGVLFYDDDVVIIKDAFPKSIRHYLVIPRDRSWSLTHPLDAFNNRPDRYEKFTTYVETAKDLIVESFVEQGLISCDNIARATFKNTFIRAGVHSIPSMANLHIHVITQDFHLARMKNKKHYNSFTTPFFVDFDDLDPSLGVSAKSDFLTSFAGSSNEDDSELDADTEPVVCSSRRRFVRDSRELNKFLRDSPLTCVYCGKQFGNSLAGLKAHLSQEYEKKFLRIRAI